MPPRSSSLAPLRHAAFRFLAGGRMVTMLGNAIAPIALAFAVLDLTNSVRDLGLVVAARSVTNVLFLLVGGVVADRLPRRLVMVTSSGLAAATQGLVAVLVLTDNATIALLMILGAVNGMVSAFAFPAASALMAQAVPVEIRKQANAISRMGTSGAMIAGASIGGLLVASVGSGWGLAVDAATFAMAGVLFAFVRVADHREVSAERANTLRELRVGWQEFISRPWVWVVVAGFCFYNMALSAAIQVLGPAIADDTFGRTAWGVVLAAQTTGMLVGALVALRVRAKRLLLVGVASCLAMVPFIAALAVAPRAVVLVPLAFLAGVALEQFGIAWETSMQEHIPADKLARVYSYDAVGSFVAMPLGQVLIGPLALAVGTPTAVLISAGVAGLAVVGMLMSRSVRTLEHLSPATPTTPPAVAVATP